MLQKYSASRLPQITPTTPAIPFPQEGRIAIVTDVGRGMRWTRQRRTREWSQGGPWLVSDRTARRRPALKRLRRNPGRQHMSRSSHFGRGSRGRQRRVVLAPVAGVKLAEICRPQPGVGGSPIRQRWRQEEFVSREQLCFRRPVYGRPQGWRCAPPPPAADGLDPVRPPVFRLGMRSAGAERDRSLCDG
jgi:hypothetical protein